MTYRKAILLHAYAIPLGIALIGALVLLIVPARFKASQQEKFLDYESYTNINQQVVLMEGKVAPNRNLAATWKQAMSGEFVKSMNDIVNKRLESLDGKQLEQEVSGARPEGAGGFALQGAQQATRTKLQFRGGYEPMQDLLLVMESSLPQMQLESFGIAEETSDGGLRYDMTYTVWEMSQTSTK